MERTIGFIGGGNMGRAMICGIRKAGLASGEQIMASAKSQETLEALKREHGIQAAGSNREVAEFAEVLFLAVKPGLIPGIVAEIKDRVRDDALILSVAAGKTIKEIEACFARPIRLIRAMPNTPAMVGEAMSALCPNSQASWEDIQLAKELFGSFGQCQVIEESLMDAVIGVSGSSPAYVYLFIEAMADGAVLGGMPRKQAYAFAAQAVLGAAKMVLDTGLHPGELKDMVCSPGGTTIEAVAELERQGMRSGVVEAMKACMEKSRKMHEK